MRPCRAVPSVWSGGEAGGDVDESADARGALESVAEVGLFVAPGRGEHVAHHLLKGWLEAITLRILSQGADEVARRESIT
jgi:hypothetical protein